MKKTVIRFIVMSCVLMMTIGAALADSNAEWNCPQCGRSGNDGNFCPHWNTDKYCSECGKPRAAEEQWALATDRLSINAGPGTRRYFKELGTYRVKGE